MPEAPKAEQGAPEKKTEGVELEDKNTPWVGWAVVGAAAIFLVSAGFVWFFYSRVDHSVSFLDKASGLGDFFGVPAAIFSGLASVFLVIALRMQSQELRLQRKELRLQRQELAFTRAELSRSAAAQEAMKDLAERAAVDADNALLAAHSPDFTASSGWNASRQHWQVTLILNPGAKSLEDFSILKSERRMESGSEETGHWFPGRRVDLGFGGDPALAPGPFKFGIQYSTPYGRVLARIVVDRSHARVVDINWMSRYG